MSNSRSRYSKAYYALHKDSIIIKHREYRQKHLEEYLKRERLAYKKWVKEHPEQARQMKNEQRKKKLFTDPVFKLKVYLRIRLGQAIKKNFKTGSAVKDLGCTIEFFKQYIQNKFYGNMTWDNWGKVWQLDHIEPLAGFDLTNRVQFLKAVHYTNLQPLTIEDHKKKTRGY